MHRFPKCQKLPTSKTPAKIHFMLTIFQVRNQLCSELAVLNWFTNEIVPRAMDQQDTLFAPVVEIRNNERNEKSDIGEGIMLITELCEFYTLATERQKRQLFCVFTFCNRFRNVQRERESFVLISWARNFVAF